ncbi:hypothetical protein MASRES_GEN12915_18695 [Acinetobacter baumannii]
MQFLLELKQVLQALEKNDLECFLRYAVLYLVDDV